MSEKAFEEWAILELMGHRRLAGFIKEQTIGSATFIRIDVPDGKGGFSATQFYNPSSVYCITPTSPEMAEAVAARDRPQPVQRWELLPESEQEKTVFSPGEPGYEEEQEEIPF